MSILTQKDAGHLCENAGVRKTLRSWIWWKCARTEFKTVDKLAINTVIFKANPDNEASASSGQPAARDVTLKAKKDFEQKPQPCSREVPDDVGTCCSKKDSFLWEGIQGNVKNIASSWKDYRICFKIESTNKMKKLNTVSDSCEAHQTNEESMYEVCWQEGSKMTSQKLSWNIDEHVYHDELIFFRAPQDHSGGNLDTSTFSHTQIEKGYAPFLYRIGFSGHEDSINIRRTCAKRF